MWWLWAFVSTAHLDILELTLYLALHEAETGDDDVVQSVIQLELNSLL